MFVGPPSVGKSTLAQGLVVARIGLRATVLDYLVDDDGGRVLYVAADRPRQVLRAMRRLVTPDDRETLDERLVIHLGPLPVDITAERYRAWLADRAEEMECTTVVVDSVKDLLSGMSDEQGAGGYNSARQEALARGIEMVEIHHNRKANEGHRKPRELDDVYGSRLLTAGAGSVLSLWAQPGEHDVELTQLKPLTDRHPSLCLVLDGQTGTLREAGAPDLQAPGEMWGGMQE
jgi:replicative DNA helicase